MFNQLICKFRLHRMCFKLQSRIRFIYNNILLIIINNIKKLYKFINFIINYNYDRHLLGSEFENLHKM